MTFDSPIYWHQGQLLQPHHFQLVDRQSLNHVAQLADAVLPHCWGVVSCAIDEAALSAGRIEITQFCARLRDGTLVTVPDNALLAPIRFVASDLATRTRKLYVGLRSAAGDQPNCSVYENWDDAGTATTRYVARTDPERVADYLGGGPEAEVRQMRYVLRLFWEDQLADFPQYDALPVAALELDGDTPRLTPGFAPPALNIAGSPALWQAVREIRDELIGRAHQLESCKAPADAPEIDVDSGHLRMVLALATLNRYGPLLCHYVETPQTHPWQVYGTLRQLVGELSLFSPRYSMLGQGSDGSPEVPPYRHEESCAQIAWMGALIARMLNEITLGPDQVVRLEHDGERWLADLPETFFGARNRYYLVVNGVDDGDSPSALAMQLKLGAPAELDALVAHSLPGLELLALSAIPSGLRRRQGAAHFRLETVSDAWACIMRERGIALFYAGAAQGLSFEIVMLRR